MRQLRSIAAIIVIAVMPVMSACTSDPVSRDTNDTTPPTITLTVTASANTADGIETVAPGSTVNLTGAGGSALIKAEDDDGVAWVEFWMNQSKNCNGVLENPGISGAPTKHVDGTVSDTSAPSSLMAGVDINTMNLTHGCTYKFEVWGKAANAATTPVITTSSIAYLTYSP